MILGRPLGGPEPSAIAFVTDMFAVCDMVVRGALRECLVDPHLADYRLERRSTYR